jgi:acetolactate synthase I/II/III large subunit
VTKTSDAIFNYLKAQGVECVFLVPGGGAMHLVDSLGRSGIPYVAMTSEQGAGYAAIGYAQATGKIGVCLTTSGPGATNAVTPCAAAWVDSVPVLFISGQSNSRTLANGQRSRGQQEITILPIVHGITKSSREEGHGWQLMDWLRYAFKLCTEGRPGPCWLSVPLDLQAEEI